MSKILKEIKLLIKTTKGNINEFDIEKVNQLGLYLTMNDDHTRPFAKCNFEA